VRRRRNASDAESTCFEVIMIQNTVKLVVWDLDDTFWQGALGEDGMVPLPRNVEMVQELARRGIPSSICSKNDPDVATRALTALDVHQYFVFPRICYSAKGKSVAEIIDAAALRAENVLFIDDNRLNLAEVEYFNPGIMAFHPSDILDRLLDDPKAQGKSDPELTRLKQYQLLQKKFEEQQTSNLSHEEFLRSCNIRVTVSHDVEQNFERVLELINRTNQLNYTKVRINTPNEVEEFRRLLGSFGYRAGCVFATDNYGDYGLIGFFLLHRRPKAKKLIHFVFSCRTMNMGIEQYIYEMLDRPDIDLAKPVSYGLQSHDAIDLIGDGDTKVDVCRNNRSVLLLGGCDLLQVASYCSSSRHEFVNKIHCGMKVRYDDPGFILSDRTAAKNSEALRQIPFWTHEDTVAFDAAVSSSELLIISMWPAMKGNYFRTQDNILLHMNTATERRMRRKYHDWMKRDVRQVELDMAARLGLISESFDSMGKSSGAGSRIFALGCYTLGELDEKSKKLRLIYNETCRAYCGRNRAKFEYVDLDAIVPRGSLVDKTHFSREGYFALARHILGQAGKADAESAARGAASAAANPVRPAALDLTDAA
jgi:FkbH-like protein